MVIGFLVVAIFLTGLLFWVIYKPNFGIAYNIDDPSNPFTFTKTGGTEAPQAEEEPEMSLNETKVALRDGGCSFVEGEPGNLDPHKCVFVSQGDFMDEALRMKLVFHSVGEEWITLYVPVREGHIACRWPREPA
jgi:hypothetical protein